MNPSDVNKLRYPNKVIIDLLKYDFLNTSVIALSEDLKINFRKFKNDLPIYFFNTGDEVYLYENMNDDNPKNSIEAAQQVPRIVLSLGSISINSDQLTNPYVRGEFIFNVGGKDTVYSSNIRRIPLTLKIKAVATVSNVIEQLRFIELIMLILYKGPTFEFQYLSKTNRGSYKISDDFETENNFELGFDSTSRRPTISFDINLDLQYPAIDYYGNSFLSEEGGIIKYPEVNVDPNGPGSGGNGGSGGSGGSDNEDLPSVETGDMEEGGRKFSMEHELIEPGFKLSGGTFQGSTMNSFDNVPSTHADKDDLDAIAAK